jgi:hypothetical protein
VGSRVHFYDKPTSQDAQRFGISCGLIMHSLYRIENLGMNIAHDE